MHIGQALHLRVIPHHPTDKHELQTRIFLGAVLDEIQIVRIGKRAEVTHPWMRNRRKISRLGCIRCEGRVVVGGIHRMGEVLRLVAVGRSIFLYLARGTEQQIALFLEQTIARQHGVARLEIAISFELVGEVIDEPGVGKRGGHLRKRRQANHNHGTLQPQNAIGQLHLET